MTCGEGGALLINDDRLVERAEIVREKGTDRSRFFRGQVDKYTWVDVGSSYLPSELLAAYLLAQLEAHAEVQARRQALWQRYLDELRDWASEADVRLPIVPRGPGASRAPVLPAAALARGAHRAHRPHARPSRPARVPLPAAAPVGDGPALRRRAAASAR